MQLKKTGKIKNFSKDKSSKIRTKTSEKINLSKRFINLNNLIKFHQLDIYGYDIIY